MRRPRIGLLLLVPSLVLSLAPSAFALTDEERAAARAAAGQGADAFDGGRWQEAVDLFSRAEALVHSPAHLLYIARAELKLGHWVKAYETFNKVKREPVAPGAPPALKRAASDASAELARLEPQLPYVAAKVKNPSGDVKVTMDGQPVPPLLIGLMRPVDPGQHQFQATNGQATSDVVTVDAKPATKQTVELELKASAAAPPPPPPPAGATPVTGPAPIAPSGPVAAAPPTTDTPADSGGGSNGLRVASFGLMGVGVAGLAVGTVFMIKGGGTQSDADALATRLCPTQACDPGNIAAIEKKDKDAASQKTIGVIGLAAGGALAATGVVLFVLSGSDEKAALRPGVRPYVGFQSVGVVGRF
jgi:hypothetical protein